MNRAHWLLLFVALTCTLSLHGQRKPTPAKPEIIAYVFKENTVIQPGEIAAEKLTRVNYAFALIENGVMVNGYAHDDENLAALVALKQQNPTLRVLISVGGWLGSGYFSDMVLTQKSRQVFIDSAVQFIKRNQLDGLDIDWEYPGQVGAGNKFRPEDKHNYTLLCRELRKGFDKEQKRLRRPLFLTVAVGADDKFLANTEMGTVQKYVDTVNLMAYDHYEPASDAVTGHHAPLFTNPADPKKVSADRSVREFEAAGVPAGKLVLGVPFYGHAWGEVDDVNHGLFRPGKPGPQGFARYGDIEATILSNGFTRYWDAAASAPYLYDPNRKIFVSYEDPESLTAKCKYVREHGLRGMMFWDYEADPAGTLLDVIDRELAQRQ